MATRHRITACCSLRSAIGGEVALFIAYKWRHSDVIIIKLIAFIHNEIPYKTYISDFFCIWNITEFMPTCLRGAIFLRHSVNYRCRLFVVRFNFSYSFSFMSRSYTLKWRGLKPRWDSDPPSSLRPFSLYPLVTWMQNIVSGLDPTTSSLPWRSVLHCGLKTDLSYIYFLNNVNKY